MNSGKRLKGAAIGLQLTQFLELVLLEKWAPFYSLRRCRTTGAAAAAAAPVRRAAEAAAATVANTTVAVAALWQPAPSPMLSYRRIRSRGARSCIERQRSDRHHRAAREHCLAGKTSTGFCCCGSGPSTMLIQLGTLQLIHRSR